MRVFKRGENWCVDYFHQGRRKRKTIGPNRKEAEAVLAKIRSQIVEGTYFDVKRSEKLRFEEMAKRYMENHASVNNSSSTRKLNPHLARVLAPRFGGKYLHEIRDLDIEQYKKARLGEGVKPATINREIVFLRSVLNKAREWGIIRGDLPRFKLFRVDNVRVRYLDGPEAEKLVQACPEPLRSVVLVALNTGMRRGELLRLRWQDVNFSERFATVRETKGKRNRHLPINRPALEVFEQLHRGKSGEYVFPGNSPGSHLSESYVTHWFRRVVMKAGIENFRFHDLRHTCASWLVMSGVDLATVQQLLGHQTYQMTLKYAHLSPEHRRSAVDILSAKTENLGAGRNEHGANLAHEENTGKLKNTEIVAAQ